MLEVRLGLEELAVRIACQRITEEELEELEQAVKEFEEAMKEDNLGVLAEADVKVHEVIYGSTHNKRLVQIISNIREKMWRAVRPWWKNTMLYTGHSKPEISSRQ